MYEFNIVTPTTISEAADALAQEEAQALGGGQTLIPTLKARLAMPETLVSLSNIPEMQGITTTDNVVRIGASATHAQVAAGAGGFPALAALAGQIGDPAVRNRGTIGGTLANNDPSACYPAAVLATGATIVTNTREIAADDYFDGMFTTVLEEGEIVTAVSFPVPKVACYLKFAQPASRFALVGVFVAKFTDSVRVAVTGAAEEGVFRWADAEAALTRDFSQSSLADIEIAADGMIGDMHGTAEYRAHLIKVLTTRAVNRC